MTTKELISQLEQRAMHEGDIMSQAALRLTHLDARIAALNGYRKEALEAKAKPSAPPPDSSNDPIAASVWKEMKPEEVKRLASLGMGVPTKPIEYAPINIDDHTPAKVSDILRLEEKIEELVKLFKRNP